MINLIKENVQYVKGIGPKRAAKLNRLGIYTVKDLLYYFPRQFEDRSTIKKIIQLEDEEKATIKAVITNIESYSPKKGMVLTRVDVKDDTGFAKLVFFNREYIKNTFRAGDGILVFGKVKRSGNFVELTSCEIEYRSKDPKTTGKVMPVYPLSYGITNRDISGMIRNVFDSREIAIPEYMPKHLIEKYRLCSIDYAIKNIHFPKDKAALKVALYRLIFEELLILQLGLFMFKGGKGDEKGIVFENSEKVEEVLKRLPFKLTAAQTRALNEINADMCSDIVMSRLVQGDVGSGKTVVAMIALANCVFNGYQGAMMAPTEILAQQHFESFSEILEPMGIKIALLTGSVSKKNKEKMLYEIASGETDIVIGTHALIEDNVEFSNIGLVITDEQHRFGVRQRGRLSSKGKNPDMMVMTATPIPRTLALILYGDLYISVIDELPPGRQKIETMAVEKKKRDKVYSTLVRKEVDKGRQVYIVCPLVEESETLDLKSATETVEELKHEYFPDLRLGLLHGKMRPSEKDEIMNAFKNKEIDILVSTTVIEVGVNVPNATLMIIENAERFGLAQLHQLRGRVGRGKHKSYCVLIYGSKSDVCAKRMEIMEDTNDGFKISEKDLEIRGPGEFFGTMQHGVPQLKVANLFKHMKILKTVQHEARIMISEDPKLEKAENRMIKNEIMEKFSNINEDIYLN